MAIPTLKSQGAMEYLMTYGWAILIVAVVLGVLYQFGVFNSSNLAPKAQPGSCRVFRPNGPGTSTFINLEGVCTGQSPQFVASFGYPSVTSSVKTGDSHLPFGGASRSVLAWVYWNGDVDSYNAYIINLYGTANSMPGIQAELIIGGTVVRQVQFEGGSDDCISGLMPTPNAWHFIGYTYQGPATLTMYLDGSSHVCTIPSALNTISSGSGYIGGTWDYWYGAPFSGDITNVQIYNTSLDAGQIQTLYAEGIGGAPISPQYLVGWWPLNGDAKDYSGNNNNGAATSVVYTSTWTK